ncbi:hypothetical protein L226DRAFT_511398 [Lentinus tigrinus ALCF2SS1-7]|uniref:uncharacterized protein n=1 Tax=Lentinus tigrinus ALCF2SS1-7 TaxID=1328758 RepID=UPI001165D43E|nr:hypothetical protein L226DRAFT_511398 [Lentinus tigrinus ALCF2SS1-7]
MLTIRDVLSSLGGVPSLLNTPLPAFSQFIRLASKLRPAIVHQQVHHWTPSVAPQSLPDDVSRFLVGRLSIPKTSVDGLWEALKDGIWYDGPSLLGEDWVPLPECTPESARPRLSARMLFPPAQVCMNSECLGHGKLLRWKDDPKRITLFTFSEGVQDALAVQLQCYRCGTVYYPNYTAYQGIRRYYAGLPEFVQVSDHKYVERTVLEHFTMLSVLSWTSATNAAHIYHESLSQLKDAEREIARYRLRAEHTWDGFVILALLRDARDQSTVLEVPNGGEQKDRFTAAMRARNERIRRSGQPEYAHYCTRCVRRFDDDGEAAFIDCIVIDGVSIGRPCCGVRHCRGELRTPQDHWCLEHMDQANFCVVEGCRLPHRLRFRTCELHAAIEEHYDATGKGMFNLRTRLQRQRVSHPTDSITPAAPVDEEIESTADVPVPILCPEKEVTGNYTARGRFGRRHTHNEQTFVRPCAMITCRETFYGSETVPQVLDMLKKKHLIPGSRPRYAYFDNNCILFKHCDSLPGETIHLEMGLPVDVFHWKCKHKKTDEACSYHCNPLAFPELLGEDGKSSHFNSSAAEQTNVWFGGYHAIVREMSAVKYDFFLDEMILRKNEITRAKLEREGCRPGYRTELRFASTDVSS